MKVLNFGSLNLDYVYQVESILIPGETQASRESSDFLRRQGPESVDCSCEGRNSGLSCRNDRG